MKIHIEEDKSVTDALYIFIEREDEKIAFAILEDEVEGIMKACKKWLKGKE